MPSYAELAALVAEKAAQLAEQAVLIEALRVELEALRRQAGRDSSNSSQPPSTDGPAAKAKAKAARRPAGGRPAATRGAAGRGRAGPGPARRKQGGQPGHRGSGLAPVATPDHREPVEPSCCAGCGGDLAGAPGTVGRPGAGVRPAHLLPGGHRVSADAPAVRLRTRHHGGPAGGGARRADLLRPERDRRGDPAGQPGRARHRAHRGPDVRAARGGGVHRVHLLLPDPPGHRADPAGFEQALKTALRGQEVLGTDETPAPLTDAASSEPDCHNPHVYTVRTMGAYTRGGADLVWYGAAGDRTKTSISGFGILDDFVGCWSATTTAATPATTATWPGSSNAWPT